MIPAPLVLLLTLLLTVGLLSFSSAAPPRQPISLSPIAGATGETTFTGLMRDLRRGGYFRIVEPGSEAAHSIIGHSSGGRIHATIVSPTGEVVNKLQYDSARLSNNIHQLADDLVVTLLGIPGIATSQITFVSDRSDKKAIYICDYDGGNLRQITNTSFPEISPALGSGGRLLWHTSYRKGGGDIYLTNLLNGVSQRVISAPGTNTGAALAPSNDTLALIMSFTGNPEIFVAKPVEGSLQRLTNTPGLEASPSWSPDGKRIAYLYDSGSGPKLQITSIDGNKVTPIDTGYANCFSPTWSPRGSEIAFATEYQGSSAVGIYNLKSGISRLVRTGGAAEPAWGPGGKHLLFTLGGELHYIDIETNAEHIIVTGMGRISEPFWGL